MKWRKSPEELVAAFESVMLGALAVMRKMFGFPADFIQGNMSMGLHEENMILGLRQASRRSWRIGQRRAVRVKFLCYEGTMQTACLRLMGKKLLVALTMEGKFAGEGLQNLDEDDDMLSAMARELVERNGIGETADAVWKALNTEHQKLFPTNSDSDNTPLIEAPAALLGTRSGPAGLVEEAIESSSVLIFGQRPGSLTGRRPRGKPTVPEQATLFG